MITHLKMTPRDIAQHSLRFISAMQGRKPVRIEDLPKEVYFYKERAVLADALAGKEPARNSNIGRNHWQYQTACRFSASLLAMDAQVGAPLGKEEFFAFKSLINGVLSEPVPFEIYLQPPYFRQNFQDAKQGFVQLAKLAGEEKTVEFLKAFDSSLCYVVRLAGAKRDMEHVQEWHILLHASYALRNILYSLSEAAGVKEALVKAAEEREG